MEYIIIGLLVVLVVVIIVLFLQLASLKNRLSVDLLKTDMVELSRTVNQLSQSVNDKLERSSVHMQTSVQKQLSESSRLIADVTQRLAKLDDTNRRVVDVASELKTLQNVLSNPIFKSILHLELRWR